VSPALVASLASLKKRRRIDISLLAHETFCPPGPLKQNVLRALQRRQYVLLARSSDRVFNSVEDRVAESRGLVSRTQAHFMPIASNLPRCPLSRGEARQRAGIDADAVVLAVFGGLEPAHRDRSLLSHALRSASRLPGHFAIYAGKDADIFTALARSSSLPHRAFRNLPDREVAELLAASDVGLAPFVGGVSARRGSFLALLQHGLATVTTDGPLVGETLRAAERSGAFVLASGSRDFSSQVVRLCTDAATRSRMRARAEDYYQKEHSWEHVSRSLRAVLDEST
jgi:glycosyltransferase involved in cell wall biosynthesis